jgi:antitoxin (DNA-binding transcriptional repressor) of toxin-antitoxin stability system
MQVTVDGRPVAELTPIAGIRRRFVARETIEELLRQAPLDAGFARDIGELTDATTDEL